MFRLILVGSLVLEEDRIKFKVFINVDVRIFRTQAMSIVAAYSHFASFALHIDASNILAHRKDQSS